MEAIKNFLARLEPRQRRIALAGAGALLVTAVALTAADDGGDDKAAAGNGPGSPASIFASRSPGARGTGVLLQSKPRYAAIRRARPRPTVVLPSERVLSVVRTRPGGVSRLEPIDTGPYSLGAVQAGLEPLPAIAVVGRGPGFDVPETGFAFAPGTTQPDLPVPPGPVPPGSAVPEPATWLLMVFGLGFVGYALRRQRQTRAPQEDSSTACGRTPRT